MYPELFFELQVRETAHRLWCHSSVGLRCVLEEAPIILHGLIETLLDFYFLHVRTHRTQLCQSSCRSRGLRRTRSATGDDSQSEPGWNGEAAHQRSSPPDWPREARS